MNHKRKVILFQVIYATCFVAFIALSGYFGSWTHWNIVTKPDVTEYMCETLEPSTFVDPSICEEE